MSYVIKAVLSNPQRPECGQITIPFPIPADQYDQTIEMLQAIGLGASVKQDCTVDGVDSHYSVLGTLVGTQVNVDQLDYLAKRLDSFCVGEDSQFQAMAHKLKLTDVQDFINLTFCCQQATVITDFSDLEAVGKCHLLTLNGGSMPMDQYQAVDGRKEALQLIADGDGTVTPYGVVYDNGMVLEQIYNGRQFPAYLYDDSPMVLEVVPQRGLAEGDSPEYLYLPASERQIERTLLRVGITAPHDARLRLDFDELPDKAAEALDLEHLSGDDLLALNRMCLAVDSSVPSAQGKLEEAITPAAPVQENAPGMIALTLATAESWYYLTLPASGEKLEEAKRALGVEGFDQAMIAGVKYSAPHLERLIPADCITVEDANALALCLREMEQEDSGLTKFRAGLSAERPGTFAEALNIAMDRDDYELVPENMEEYGKQVLRRIGADDKVIDIIDGYMDFAQLGTDSIAEDGVRRTEFGLVRRLSLPFPPEPEIGQTMM